MAKATLNMGAIRKLVYADPPIYDDAGAEQLGISRHVYAAARYVIYLFDEELTTEEWAAGSEALRHVVKTEVAKARKFIDPVMRRHFGVVAKGRGPMMTRDLNVRKFLGAVVTLTDQMAMCPELVVPWMPGADREVMAADLDAAITNVTALKAIILKGGSSA